jgi:DNA damage-responsive transcriptional repressor / [histone H3]-trimethyl-L-lysine36 demethylase
MHEKYPDLSAKCPEFIRHKNTLVNPNVLLSKGIKMVKSIHQENEFMISRAAAYHSGFNFGFNIAEAVNFALPDWLNIGGHCGFCKCINDSVTINMRSLLRNLSLRP